MAQVPGGPTEVIAQKVRELRRVRGLSGRGLAEAMTSHGVAWDRAVVANLENGRRRSVSVDEWLTLAEVLDVAPLDLLAPRASSRDVLRFDDQLAPLTAALGRVADGGVPLPVIRAWVEMWTITRPGVEQLVRDRATGEGEA